MAVSSNQVINAVAQKIQHYMELQRKEDGFDLSGPNQPQRAYPRLKTGSVLSSGRLHDRSLKHYFTENMIKTQIANLEAMPPGSTRQRHVKQSLKKSIRRAPNQNNGVNGLSTIKDEMHSAQLEALHFLERETQHRIRNKIHHSSPILRKSVSPRISRSETSRLINRSSQILVATETVALAHDIITRRSDTMLRPQSAPAAPNNNHLPGLYKSPPRPKTARGHFNSTPKRRRKPKYAWDINGRRVPFDQLSDGMMSQQLSSSTCSLSSSSVDFEGQRSNRPRSSYTRPGYYGGQGRRNRSAHYRPFSADPSFIHQPAPPEYVMRQTFSPDSGFSNTATQTEYKNVIVVPNSQSIHVESREIELQHISPKIVCYRVEVKTCDKLGAGTTADVYLSLHGDKAESDEIYLTNTIEEKNVKQFRRGQVDVFEIETEDVGKLAKIGIGHDQKDKGSSWLVDYVKVSRDDEVWKFPLKSWLSGTFADRKTFRFFTFTSHSDSSSSSSDESLSDHRSQSSHNSSAKSHSSQHSSVKSQSSDTSSTESQLSHHSSASSHSSHDNCLVSKLTDKFINKNKRSRSNSSLSSRSTSSSSSDGHSGKGQVAEPHRNLKNTMDQVKEQQTKGAASNLEYSSDSSANNFDYRKEPESYVEESEDTIVSSQSSSESENDKKKAKKLPKSSTPVARKSSDSSDLNPVSKLLSVFKKDGSSSSESDETEEDKRDGLFSSIFGKKDDETSAAKKSDEGSSDGDENVENPGFFSSLLSKNGEADKNKSSSSSSDSDENTEKPGFFDSLLSKKEEKDTEGNKNQKSASKSSSSSSDSDENTEKPGFFDSLLIKKEEKDTEEYKNQKSALTSSSSSSNSDEDTEKLGFFDSLLSKNKEKETNDKKSTSKSNSSSSDDEKTTKKFSIFSNRDDQNQSSSFSDLKQEKKSLVTNTSSPIAETVPLEERETVSEIFAPIIPSTSAIETVQEPITEEIKEFDIKSSSRRNSSSSESNDDEKEEVPIVHALRRLGSSIMDQIYIGRSDSDHKSDEEVSKDNVFSEASSSKDFEQIVTPQADNNIAKSSANESSSSSSSSDSSSDENEQEISTHISNNAIDQKSSNSLSENEAFSAHKSDTEINNDNADNSIVEEQAAVEQHLRKSIDHKEIHELVKEGNLENVIELIGLFPNLRENLNDKGWTPLHVAATNGNLPILKWLSATGSNLQAETATGYTAMHMSAMNGHNECIEVLHAMGANFNVTNIDGQTPLHLSCMSGHLDTTRWLVSNHADIAMADNFSRSALDLAKQYRHKEIVEYLKPMVRQLRNSTSSSIKSSSKSSIASSSSASSSSSSSSSGESDLPELNQHERRRPSLFERQQSDLEERKKVYEHQHDVINKRRTSFLDAIRDELDS